MIYSRHSKSWCDDPFAESFPSRGCFFGGGGGSPSGSTTTTQNNTPWSGLQPYLSGTGSDATPPTNTPGVYQSALNLYNSGGPQYFPGVTYSPETQAQQTGLQNTINTAGNDPFTGIATNYSNNALSGSYLNSNTANPYLTPYASGQMLNNAAPQTQAAINTAISQAVPGIESQFTGGNSMNSPGAAFAVGQGITSAAAPYVLQAQEQGQANQLNAAQQLGTNYNNAAQQQVQNLAFAPNTQSLPYTDASQMTSAGGQQQQFGQNTINAAMQKYNYQQTLPFNMLDYYNSIISGSPYSTSSLTSPYFSQPNNTAGQVISGLGSAAAIAGLLL